MQLVTNPVAPTTAPRRSLTLIGAALIGAVVSISLGVYGRVHNATGQAIVTFGFPRVLPMKAWLATGAFVLALVQLYSALRMWDRIHFPRVKPTWLATAHRWTGTVAFVLTLPVAYHCLWSLGFQTIGTRQVVHSVLGCAFYGAFTTKMLALRSRRVPRWAIPVLGGLLVTLLSAIWLTSSLWFFRNVGFPGL
jgi:hypothetical protein